MTARFAALVIALSLAACATPAPSRGGVIIADDAPEIAARPQLYDLSDVSTASAENTPPLFVFEKDGQTLSIFGTMHAVPGGLRWLNAEVKRAFTEADLVLTEVGTTDSAQYNPRTSEMAELMPLMTRDDGLNTLDLVGLPGTAARAELDAAIEMTGLKTHTTQTLKPWTLCIDLQRPESHESVKRLSLEAQRERFAGMDAVGPLDAGRNSPDARLERFRLSQGLAHRQLETFATRARVYATMPDEDALACIRARAHAIVTGTDWTTFPERFSISLARWRRGDIEGARQTEFEVSAKLSPGYAVRLYQAREASWMPAIDALCAKARCAIAVGFAHLGGSDGLLKRIEALGWRPVKGKGGTS